MYVFVHRVTVWFHYVVLVGNNRNNNSSMLGVLFDLQRLDVSQNLNERCREKECGHVTYISYLHISFYTVQ